MKNIHLLSICFLWFVVSCTPSFDKVAFYDDFSAYPVGSISSPVGAHTEYHYLKDAQLNPVWKVTSFYFSPRGADTAWRVVEVDGLKSMQQNINNPHQFTHPMITAGNIRWKNYKVTVEFTPATSGKRSGLAFRAQNDRQYYFFGLNNNELVLTKRNHENNFHTPEEPVLEVKYSFNPDTTKIYRLCVEVDGSKIKGWIDGEKTLNGKYHKYLGSWFPNEFAAYCCVGSDTAFSSGNIALVADGPATFYSVKVETTDEEMERIKAEEEAVVAAETKLQETNPKPVLWKKISTAGFGVGRNLRFGDLNNDGQTDVLVGQVVHHAYPRDSYTELSCITAMTFDGKKLWQIGTPSSDHEKLTNDVAFQIFDLDNDGRNEVIYTMNSDIIVADAATGKTLFKQSTPAFKSTQFATDSKPDIVKEWDRILGDCLFLCDLRGNGYPQDIVIKNRYTKFWVLDEKLNIQWSAECRTGHYPYSKDIDGDGHEELFIGYSCFNWKGEVVWNLDKDLEDHCDGVGVTRFREGGDFEVFLAASDQGAVVLDKSGQIKRRHLVGHVQNPAIANFRDDLPGLETVSVNFWGSQGIIHFYDSDQKIYHSFEPTQYGSMCLPVNWNGSSEELFVLNANVREGGMYNGLGRRAVLFPNDGHPDMCNAVLNITGDLRDEVVVWNPNEIWIYTQSDSPKTGNLHPSKRNPMYNYSNYQLTVSEPVFNK